MRSPFRSPEGQHPAELEGRGHRPGRPSRPGRCGYRWRRSLAASSLIVTLAGLVGVVGLAHPPAVSAQQPGEPGSFTESTNAPTPTSGAAQPPQTPPSTSNPPTSASEAVPPPSSPVPPSSSGPPPSSTEPAPSLPPAPKQSPNVRPGPGRVWTLTASKLTLKGVRYQGFAMKEVAGKQVKTMHFTVDRLEITNLVQRGLLRNGKVVKAAGAPGSVSTVTDGPIQLYTRKLTGTLNVAGFPAVPVTMSPESLMLPNIDLSFLKLPSLTFTDAVVRNVALSGGSLHIPGASITLE